MTMTMSVKEGVCAWEGGGGYAAVACSSLYPSSAAPPTPFTCERNLTAPRLLVLARHPQCSRCAHLQLSLPNADPTTATAATVVAPHEWRRGCRCRRRNSKRLRSRISKWNCGCHSRTRCESSSGGGSSESDGRSCAVTRRGKVSVEQGARGKKSLGALVERTVDTHDPVNSNGTHVCVQTRVCREGSG